MARKLNEALGQPATIGNRPGEGKAQTNHVRIGGAGKITHLAVEPFMSHAKIKPAGYAGTRETAWLRESACVALAVGIDCPLVG